MCFYRRITTFVFILPFSCIDIISSVKRGTKLDEKLYVLNKQSNRVTRYHYKFHDKWYIIPYDKNTHKVITIFEDKIQDVIMPYAVANIPQYVSNNRDKPKNRLKIFIQPAQFVKNFTRFQKSDSRGFEKS